MTSTVYVVYRNTSPYTEAPILVGAFRTQQEALAGKHTYIALVKERSDVFHSQQGYHTVDLEVDVCIATQQIDTFRHHGSKDLVRIDGGDPTKAATTQRLWVLYSESDGFGQVCRSPAALLSSQEARVEALDVMRLMDQDDTWEAGYITDDIVIGVVRLRNTDSYARSEEKEKDTTYTASRLVGELVQNRARAYEELQRVIGEVCNDPPRQHKKTIQDFLPLMNDDKWPGTQALHRAHDIITKEWLTEMQRSTPMTTIDVFAGLHKRLDDRVAVGSPQSREQKKDTLALAYILDEFRICAPAPMEEEKEQKEEKKSMSWLLTRNDINYNVDIDDREVYDTATALLGETTRPAMIASLDQIGFSKWNSRSRCFLMKEYIPLAAGQFRSIDHTNVKSSVRAYLSCVAPCKETARAICEELAQYLLEDGFSVEEALMHEVLVGAFLGPILDAHKDDVRELENCFPFRSIAESVGSRWSVTLDEIGPRLLVAERAWDEAFYAPLRRLTLAMLSPLQDPSHSSWFPTDLLLLAGEYLVGTAAMKHRE